MIKNLYVNGCSYTAGHDLEDNETWPVKLAQKLNVTLTCDAINGGSFDTITAVSTTRLTQFDPTETLVVIGITWPPRFGVRYGHSMVNITQSDLGRHKVNFQDKCNKARRISNPGYSNYDKETLANEIRPNRTVDTDTFRNYCTTLTKFREYLETKVSLDPNFIENTILNTLTNLLLLQSYLRDRGFTYKFIQFPYDEELWSDNFYPEIKQQIDFTNIIPMQASRVCPSMKNSHPSADCCDIISDIITKELNLNQ